MTKQVLEYIINDFIDYQNRAGNVGCVVTVHIHLKGGACVSLGQIAKISWDTNPKSDMFCVLYSNKDEKPRFMYGQARDVIAVVAVEV